MNGGDLGEEYSKMLDVLERCLDDLAKNGPLCIPEIKETLRSVSLTSDEEKCKYIKKEVKAMNYLKFLQLYS